MFAKEKLDHQLHTKIIISANQTFFGDWIMNALLMAEILHQLTGSVSMFI